VVIDLYLREGLRFPDVTVFVDFDSREAVRRIDQRGMGRKEYETEEILEAVSRSYRRIVRNGALAACTSVIEVSGHEPHAALAELDRLLLAGAGR
jgi:thymidylate kinase